MGSHSRLKIIMPDDTVAATAPDRSADPVSSRELMPLAKVRRIGLIEREIREFLSQAALDAVFAHMQVMSEGEASVVHGKKSFAGCTMLTCDLAELSHVLREPVDEGTTRRLSALLPKEPTLERRIQSVVRREVERIAGTAPTAVRGETRVRTQGTQLFLDIDVEASFP